jgi:hypothetical protein
MTLRTFIIAAMVALVATTAQAQEALSIGGALPTADRVMQNANGAAASLAQQMGPRGLAVVFWSQTCPWVVRYERRVMDLATEYGQAGVGFALVSSNDPVAFPGDAFHSMRDRAAAEQYTVPYFLDGGSEAARAFGALRTPQVFLFNAEGRLVYEGAVDDSPADPAGARDRYFRDALSQVVAGQPVTVQKTRAFGCTIKYHD